MLPNALLHFRVRVHQPKDTGQFHKMAKTCNRQVKQRRGGSNYNEIEAPPRSKNKGQSKQHPQSVAQTLNPKTTVCNTLEKSCQLRDLITSGPEAHFQVAHHPVVTGSFIQLKNKECSLLTHFIGANPCGFVSIR